MPRSLRSPPPIRAANGGEGEGVGVVRTAPAEDMRTTPHPNHPHRSLRSRGEGAHRLCGSFRVKLIIRSGGLWFEIRVRAVLDALGPFCPVGARVLRVLVVA